MYIFFMEKKISILSTCVCVCGILGHGYSISVSFEKKKGKNFLPLVSGLLEAISSGNKNFSICFFTGYYEKNWMYGKEKFIQKFIACSQILLQQTKKNSDKVGKKNNIG